jgi:hypothetical protein
MFTDALTSVDEDCAVAGWFDRAGCCAALLFVLVFALPLFGVCCAWLAAGGGLLLCAWEGAEAGGLVCACDGLVDAAGADWLVVEFAAGADWLAVEFAAGAVDWLVVEFEG